MEIKTYFVYILTNFKRTVLYTGVTNNLSRRCFEHKSKLRNGFTSKYNVNILIYYEIYDYIDLAISREKKNKITFKKEKRRNN